MTEGRVYEAYREVLAEADTERAFGEDMGVDLKEQYYRMKFRAIRERGR